MSTAVPTSSHQDPASSKFDGERQMDSERLVELARASSTTELPNRLLTALEVAEFVGCHEETIRRAYLRGLLASQRFGVRSRRFHRADVLDWIRRGAPTRVF